MDLQTVGMVFVWALVALWGAIFLSLMIMTVIEGLKTLRRMRTIRYWRNKRRGEFSGQHYRIVREEDDGD